MFESAQAMRAFHDFFRKRKYDQICIFSLLSSRFSQITRYVLNTISGRHKEIKILESIIQSQHPEFLAIYGRRRVGKTFLISEFFKNKGIYFELTGIKDASVKVQLNNFTIEYSDLFYMGRKQPIPSDWFEAFTLLRYQIEQIETQHKIILFLDELPWLAGPKSHFLQALDHFWNRYMSRDHRIILIICGSAASWMIKNVINNKAGLHGRLTREIRLMPFDLSEVEAYCKAKDIDLERKQLLEIYMAIGGVAKYLTYIERGKSSAQIINDSCFCGSGGLYKEFNKLYASLFNHYEQHIKIIKTLAKNRSGLTKNELLNKTGMKSGGTTTKIFNELEESSFIVYTKSFNKPKNSGKYRLTDEYSLFYLTWIENIQNISIRGVEKDYWIKKYNSKAWISWSAYAFESICLKHIENIKQALGISGVSTIESCWFVKSQNKPESGVQIDLVIDRADHCINLCEIKFYSSVFKANKKFVEDQTNKKKLFQNYTKTKKALFITLITTYGAEENRYYQQIVDNQLTMDDLFK